MSFIKLDHFAIVTNCLDETIKFYVDILELEQGPKLDGGFGEFLFFPNTDQAVIHLLSTERAKHVDNNKPAGFQVYGIPDGVNTGTVDHIAFKSDAIFFNRVLNKLKIHNVEFRLGKELEPKILQIWFFDPNKIKVEVTCNQYTF